MEPIQKWPLQRKVAAGFVVLAVMLCGVAWVTVQSLAEYKISTDKVERTQEVLEHIEHVHYQLREAESSQRGYVLTGQDAYLEAYYSAKRGMQVDVERLGILTKDNDVQQLAHQALSAVVIQRLARMDAVIQVRQRAGVNAAMKEISTGPGRQLSESVIATLANMKTEEKRLLALRDAGAEDRASRALWMMGLAGVTTAVLLVGMYLLVSREIARREKTEGDLRFSEERYALAAQSTNDGLWDWDVTNDKMYLSPRWKAIVGYFNDEIESSVSDWFIRIHPDDQEKVAKLHDDLKNGEQLGFEAEYRMRHKDGHYIWVLVRGMAALSEDPLKTAGARVARVVGAMSDISLRKRYEEELMHKATHDPLTGLGNREYFREQLSKTMSASRRHGYPLSLCLCDLDKFKQINDTYGHGWGDRVLQKFSQVVKDNIRNEDVAARLGGDEFCIMFPHTEVEHVKALLNRIRREIAEFEFISERGEKFNITASFGVAQLTPETTDLKSFMDAADEALYRAKEHRNEVEVEG